MYQLLLHPDVKSDIKHSFDWYQEQSLGLGNEFIQELEEAFQSIQSLPLAWSLIDPEHRRYVLSRFPYSVIYTVETNNNICIVTVMHNQRKPRFWQSRTI